MAIAAASLAKHAKPRGHIVISGAKNEQLYGRKGRFVMPRMSRTSSIISPATIDSGAQRHTFSWHQGNNKELSQQNQESQRPQNSSLAGISSLEPSFWNLPNRVVSRPSLAVPEEISSHPRRLAMARSPRRSLPATGMRPSFPSTETAHRLERPSQANSRRLTVELGNSDDATTRRYSRNLLPHR